MEQKKYFPVYLSSMLRITPIPEQAATEDIRSLYESIKTTIGSDSVPLIFQYLAVFPEYVHFLWEQTSPNLSDPSFQKQTREILRFGELAIASVYSPSPLMELLLERITNQPEQQQLQQSAEQLQRMNASLYFLSLAVRESLKGKYLGIPQIGAHLSPEEKRTFYSVAEAATPVPIRENTAANALQTAAPLTTRSSASTGLTLSLYQKFFSTIEQEMEALMKREAYLSRRVELERFALAKLPLLPYPLDSSFVTMTRQCGDHPLFPELLYLLSDVFPTQTPYKLLASLVMQNALSLTR